MRVAQCVTLDRKLVSVSPRRSLGSRVTRAASAYDYSLGSELVTELVAV